MSRKILIFGAGKIGRGFTGHLFHRAGYELTFVDPVAAVVDQLNRDKSFPLFMLGAPEKNEMIPVKSAILLSNEAVVVNAVAEHDLFVTAVGGPNLEALGKILAKGLEKRFAAGHITPANIIICENYKDPASILRKSIMAASSSDAFKKWAAEHLGIAETQVLRSCIEPDPEMKKKNPLSVQVQDWWVLPVDRDAFRGPIPVCEGLSPRPNFQNELIRKVYTYNCSNATISYLGYLRGYTMLSEAANDPEILEVTYAVYDESGKGLIAEYHFDPVDQKSLQQLAISKYQDRDILDPIERNGRDTQRKLSPTDRLLGPANLVLKHGGTPKNLAMVLAAGIHYALSTDPGTLFVQNLLKTQGLKAVIRDVCKVDPDSKMGKLIREGVKELPRFNKLGVKLYSE